MINIPFRSFTGERALEQSKTNGVLGNGIGGTPHMEGLDMVGGILTSKAFKLGNVRGELGWNSGPTNIMADMVINELIEVGETKANHIRE